AHNHLRQPDVRRTLYLPGNSSTYDQIRQLTANTYFSFEERRTRRFWPEAENDRTPLPARELARLLSETMRLLSIRNDLLLSMTAGLDSRVALAAMGNTPALLYTFVSAEYGDKGMAADAEVARRLAWQKGFPHVTLTAPVLHDGFEEKLQDTREASLVNTSGARLEAFPDLYTAHKAVFHNKLHLRSNCAEIARGFYQKAGRSTKKPTIAALADCYGFQTDSDFTKSSIESFIDDAEFSSDRMSGYSFYDLFYWETRMSVWQANVILESDVAFETVVPLNNRKILAGLLAYPLEDRMAGSFFKEAIAELSPDLLSEPFNAHEAGRNSFKAKLPDPVRKALRTLNRRIKTRL
ncbi:MAG: hypothetical protein WA908_12035, partial [Pontixanthobacter sp.]